MYVLSFRNTFELGFWGLWLRSLECKYLGKIWYISLIAWQNKVLNCPGRICNLRWKCLYDSGVSIIIFTVKCRLKKLENHGSYFSTYRNLPFSILKFFSFWLFLVNFLKAVERKKKDFLSSDKLRQVKWKPKTGNHIETSSQLVGIQFEGALLVMPFDEKFLHFPRYYVWFSKIQFHKWPIPSVTFFWLQQ